MKFTSRTWAPCIVLVLVLVSVAATSPQAGQAQLVIISYVGGQMTFTLDGTAYPVPGTDTQPSGGQLALTLAAGRHTYSAHVPGSEGANGDLELTAGQSRVLGARLERSAPVISPAGIVLEKPRDILVFFEASLTPAAPAPAPQALPLQPLPPGQGGLVLVNYIGEELAVDIQGVLYKVPADGRLQVNLPPGDVTYSASAGVSGINGTAQVRSGVYTGLGFTRETGPQEPDYDVGEPVPTPVPLKISVFPVLLDAPVAGALSRPAAPPVPVPAAQPMAIPADQGQLGVVNYIGETLTFTVNDRAYAVAGSGGKLEINLTPGEYTFTASTPRSAVNGSLRVMAGAAVHVSVTLDMPSGQVKIYTE
jgi:hypothetical protein